MQRDFHHRWSHDLLAQGLVISNRPVGELVVKSLEEGLLVITAGSNVMRFVPPLIITKEHVDEMIEKFERALKAD